MLRVKTFDATGVAPSGILFAGDLNAIQDAAAALSDLSQNLRLGTLTIGENALQLLRFGVVEARLTGALRTDGILRGLGGLYAGAYTTTQRDALPQASRPFGLIILNTATNRLEINLGSDVTPNWQSLGSSLLRGTLAARPSAQPSNQNQFYLAQDDDGGTLYYSDGSSWTQIAAGVTQQMVPLNNSVDSTKIVNGAVLAVHIGSDVPVFPIGGVMDWPWASGSIPAWTLLPFGQLLTAVAYPAMQVLADAAGRPYGGTAATNFNMPDYRGSIGVGKDNMGGTAANRITAAISGVAGTTLGAVFGAEGITLTTGQIPAHNHTGTVSGTTSAPNITVEESGTGGGYPFGSGTSDQGVSATHTHTFSAGFTTANTGGGAAHQNTQPSIIVNKIMRVL